MILNSYYKENINNKKITINTRIAIIAVAPVPNKGSSRKTFLCDKSLTNLQ